MEKVTETPPKSPEELAEVDSGCKTPTPVRKAQQNPPNSGSVLRKTSTPDLLKVPKAFKYPEKYTSPTDLMMSPVTKGLLARSRKGAAHLPPTKNQLKIPETRLQDVSLLQS